MFDNTFRLLVDNLRAGIALNDEEGRLITWNPAMTALTGIPAGDVLGRPIWDVQFEILPPAQQTDERRIQLEHDLDNLLANGSALWNEGTSTQAHTRPDGSPLWLEMRIFSIPTQRGFLLCSIVRDVTEQKIAEQTLCQRARQQSVLVQLGQSALSGMDLQQLMDLTVQKMTDLLGIELCKILELLPDNAGLLLKAGTGWNPGLVGRAIVDDGLDSQAGFTLLSDEPIIVEDMIGETRFRGPALLHEHGVISGASVRIGSADQPYGVLGIHTRRKRVFDRDDVQFLISVANVLGTAVARRQAENQIQRYADELEARVAERTSELRRIVDLMAGREIRMAELRGVIVRLREQLQQAGLRPEADDPLRDGL